MDRSGNSVEERRKWPRLGAVVLAGAAMVSSMAIASARLAGPEAGRRAVAPPADDGGGAPLNPHGAAAADAYRDKGDAIDPAVLASGQSTYEEVCSACHEAGVNRAPQRFILSQLPPERIYHALTQGVMVPMAADLDDGQKRAVAQFITKRAFGSAEAMAAPKMCTAGQSVFDYDQTPAFAGWGLDPASTHSQSDAEAGVTRANAGRLKLKWAVGFPSALRARSQPGIAGGAFYVGSHDGTVYALDAETGCARFTFQAVAEVRTGIVISPWTKGDKAAHPIAYFGDLIGNAYAIDAVTGKQLWRVHADEHPSTTLTAAPALHDGLLYVPVSSLEEGAAGTPGYSCCTFRGSVLALDAKTGKQVWRTYLVDEPKRTGDNASGGQTFGPSGVAIWNTPAIDAARGQMYIDTGDSYSSPAAPMSDAIVALDLKTGAIRWAWQARPADAWNTACEEHDTSNCPEEKGPDFDFGAGTVLARGANGKDYVIAGQKSGVAYALDPATGKLAWKQQVGRGGVVGGIHFGMAAVNGRIFVPVSDVPDGKSYDMAPNPGLFALDIATGAYVWKAPATADVCKGKPFCHPGYSAAITATPQLVAAGGNDGHVRLYDAASGKVVWDVDTTAEVTTVNGTRAHGGSMSGGAAPIFWKGKLLINSGYGFAGKMPGNVMLVYSVE